MENNSIAFSHRPRVGISVGIYVKGETAYLSAAFRNASDPFNRKLARTIVASRMNSRMTGDVRFTYALPSNGADALGIMNAFRESFKPDPEEADSTFEVVGDFGGVETRSPFSRDEAWSALQSMFIDALVTALSRPAK